MTLDGVFFYPIQIVSGRSKRASNSCRPRLLEALLYTVIRQMNCGLVRADVSYWWSSPRLLQTGGERPQTTGMWYQAPLATTTLVFCFESHASETSFANSSSNRNCLQEPVGWRGINRGIDHLRKTWPSIPQRGTVSPFLTTASLKLRAQGSRGPGVQESRPYSEVDQMKELYCWFRITKKRSTRVKQDKNRGGSLSYSELEMLAVLHGTNIKLHNQCCWFKAAHQSLPG